MNKKLIFMGTGPFALTALEGLFAHLEEGDSLSVYTKEAKKAGRGMKEKDGCVAAFARENGLALYQPHSLKEEAAKEEFLALEADLVIVASYGLILPSYVIHAPTFGCINIHASLLPKYRGAAPINRAVLDGEKMTGVTLMQMDEGLDTGDMIAVEETPIGEEETAGELFERLALLGRDMLLAILPDVYDRKLTPVPQNHEQSTYASKLTAEDQAILWEETTDRILCRIRALSPIPGAICRTERDGKILKIYGARRAEGIFEGKAGEVVSVKPYVVIKTCDGAISLSQVQPEGKGRMDAKDAVNGRKIAQGDRLI